MLESEKASIAKRFVDGPTTVIPAGAVLSILTLQEKDKLEVRIGEYNHRLTEKIREIKMTCGLESVVDMEASDETNGSHRDQFADREVQEGARSPVIPTEDLER